MSCEGRRQLTVANSLIAHLAATPLSKVTKRTTASSKSESGEQDSEREQPMWLDDHLVQELPNWRSATPTELPSNERWGKGDMEVLSIFHTAIIPVPVPTAKCSPFLSTATLVSVRLP